MKSIKRILLSVLVLATLVMSFALTSCGECEHEWGDWEATGAATCSGTAEKRVCSECGEEETRTNGDATAHTWGAWSVKTAATCVTAGVETRACANCVATETRPIAALGHAGEIVCEKCYGALFTLPEVDFSAYRSVGFDMTDYTLTLDFSGEERVSNIINSGVMTIDVIKGYVGLDENDALIGAGEGEIKFAGTNTPVDNTLTIAFFIENNVIYMSAKGAIPTGNANYDENQYVKVSLDTLEEKEEIEGALAEVEALLPEIEEWYNDVLVPVFDSVSVNTDGAKAFAVKVINSLLKKTAATDGSFTVTIDFEAIKDFNETLATKKISEMVDVILGEGVYADIKSYVTSDEFYALSVADLVDYIETEQGVALEDLFAAVDALLAITTPDGQTAPTFNALIAQALEIEDPEFDAVALLRGEEMAEYSVMAALKSNIPGVEDDPATEDVDEAAVAIKEMIAGVFTQIESVTVYDLVLGGGASGEQSGPAPAADEEDPAAAMVEYVNSMIDAIAEMVVFTANFDKNGAFVSTVIDVTVALSSPEIEVSATITLTAADVTLDFAFSGDMGDVAPEAEAIVKIVPGKTVAVDAAKLAAIKAAFAKVPTITETVFMEAVKDRVIWSDSRFAYYVENGVLYALEIENVYAIAGGAKVNVVAYKVAYTDELQTVTLTEGCTNVIHVTFGITEYYAKGSFEASAVQPNDCNASYIIENFLNTNAKIAEVFATIPENAWESDTTSPEFRYNIQSQTFSYGYDGYIGYESETIEYNGHNYVLDETKSEEAESCTDVGKRHYKCTICQDEYDYYYIPGHSTFGGSVYVLKDSTAGLAGGFAKGEICVNEGCGFILYDYDILVDADASLNAVYYNLEDETYAEFKITVAEAGTYRFYTDAADDAWCDTAVEVWALDGTDAYSIEYNDYYNGIDNGHCYLELELEAGEYIVGVKNYSVEVGAYTIHVEAAE